MGGRRWGEGGREGASLMSVVFGEEFYCVVFTCCSIEQGLIVTGLVVNVIIMRYDKNSFLCSLFGNWEQHLHKVTWCMVVWCTQNLRRDGSSFLWHQPWQRCKYTTSSKKRTIKKLATHVESHASAVSLLESRE